MIPANIQLLASDAAGKRELTSRLLNDLLLMEGFDETLHLRIESSSQTMQLLARDTQTGKTALAVYSASAQGERWRTADSIEVNDPLAYEQLSRIYLISLDAHRPKAAAPRGRARVFKYSGQDVTNRLVEGGLLVPQADAMLRADRCAQHVGPWLERSWAVELLLHAVGWVWAIFYETYGRQSHVALIHADGELLTPEQAEPVLAAYAEATGLVQPLEYLVDATRTRASEQAEGLLTAYRQYIVDECGEMQLDGLPADEEVVSKTIRLESLFVPLYLEPPRGAGLVGFQQAPRERAGDVLARRRRLVLLAPPGGGKSTLLQRWAVAYADPARRFEVADGLPERPWLPVFVRCRQLEATELPSMRQRLRSIVEQVNLGAATADFERYLGGALRRGEVLLLIDGLDEIAIERLRVAFIRELRLFLARYPTITVVVTMRFAGFRAVGGALRTHFEEYSLVELDDAAIKQLAIRWHEVVLGAQPAAHAEAERLALTLCQSNRLRLLAVNPLLLTTLLLLARWVRHLPTNRSVLYGKVVEVLLMTWNVEGFQALDPTEVVPQLAFVALQMQQMGAGVQSITVKEFKELLTAARSEMPEILAYCKVSIHEFVQRVESRSSLLIISGYVHEGDTLEPTCEFRHLTLQEYLVAVAVVEGYLPQGERMKSLVELVEPHFEKDRWKEVIPLIGALAGRRAQPLIERLVELCGRKQPSHSQHEGRSLSHSPLHRLLAQWLLDEVPTGPALVERGLAQLIIWWRSALDGALLEPLARGRYAEILQTVASRLYTEGERHRVGAGNALAASARHALGYASPDDLSEWFAKAMQARLAHGAWHEKVGGALLLVEIIEGWAVRQRATGQAPAPEAEARLQALGDALIPLLQQDQHTKEVADRAQAALRSALEQAPGAAWRDISSRGGPR